MYNLFFCLIYFVLEVSVNTLNVPKYVQEYLLFCGK